MKRYEVTIAVSIPGLNTRNIKVVLDADDLASAIKAALDQSVVVVATKAIVTQDQQAPVGIS